MSRALADILLRDKIITQQQHQEAVDANKARGESHVRYLIAKKYVAEPKLLQFLSQKYSMPAINLAKYEINQEIIKIVPMDLAKKHNVVPIQTNKNVLVVAVADPTVLVNIEDIKFRTKMNIEAVLTTPSALDATLNRYYSGSVLMADAVSQFQKTQEKDNENAFEGLNASAIQIDAGAMTDKDAPVVSLVNNILVEAMRKGASDIHIESYEHRSRVRLRIDGVLQEVIQIPPEMKRPLMARVKIMSKLDISESRMPQDGRIKIKVGTGEIDFRVSTMPCLFGEKAVLRLLSKGNLQLDLGKLGFEPKQLEIFRKGTYQPNGMVLVTGPTGSGKTTTLYSALAELNKSTDNISTAEDPVEYNLDGINQCQVNKDINLTFASVLKTFLRQDPDIILVGEIRDAETAEVSIQAALTGHLVLSTLHTNDAPSTVMRLMNMGIEAFLVTASVNTIVAQRLLRSVCPKCREPMQVPIARLVELGIAEEIATQLKLFKGRGCPTCNNTGYKGRTAVYEVLDFTPTLKEMILAGATALEFKRAAIREGMKTLRMSALQRAAEGKTTLEEALSITAAE
ncbi:MAG TPA: type IV-A pilus assembly ATPase PilB [Oligoflexia bacterium]|nr:type IV-A pilus assembly ATPase PilB [Oligoflexia bacterium]